jgi:hypothetical protein
MPKVAILHPGIYGNPENDALTTSFLADVTVVRYVAGMTEEELLAAIREAIPAGLTHVSFVYHNPGYSSLPFFPDVPGASGVSGEKPKYRYFSNTVIDFLKTLRSVSSNGLTVDILACDLKEAAYVEEVQKIETDLDINIRYSAGKIGNPPNGSWTLESKEIAVNIRDIYFTDGVLAWNGVLINLAPDIKALSNPYSDYIRWDYINTYTVQQDFTWTALGLDATDFIELSGNEIFDGSGYEIDISGLSWEGLITISPSVTNIGTAPLIKNLGVIRGDIGGLSGGGGAIVQKEQKFFSIRSCWSTGDISGYEAGGIAGGYSGQIGGECDISGCYSTGTIYGNTAGGIVGPNAGESGGLCTITECYSTGEIPSSGGEAGGIAGANAGTGSAGTCIINNCYSTGAIFGQNAGCIAGANAGSFGGICEITGCYSQGQIGGGGAGGIAGAFAGKNGGTCIISECYSIESPGGGGAGGIVGSNAGAIGGTCTISNCYSTGLINGGGAGGIAGDYAGSIGTCDISNCYSAGIHTTAGGITGWYAGDTGGSCNITCCVCNGEPIIGSGSTATIIDCCSNLIVIDDNLYPCWNVPSPSLVWESGGEVAGYNLPILTRFRNSPWNSDLYNAADDLAGFGTPSTTPPNSFALRVNPFVALSPVLVYTQETMDALVDGLPLPITSRVSWASTGMPAGSLLRDLGRAVVVKVSPTNPLHAYRFQKIQLIRGPTTEGVGGSPADSWQTGYICVWAASGVAPVFP